MAKIVLVQGKKYSYKGQPFYFGIPRSAQREVTEYLLSVDGGKRFKPVAHEAAQEAVAKSQDVLLGSAFADEVKGFYEGATVAKGVVAVVEPAPTPRRTDADRDKEAPEKEGAIVPNDGTLKIVGEAAQAEEVVPVTEEGDASPEDEGVVRLTFGTKTADGGAPAEEV